MGYCLKDVVYICCAALTWATFIATISTVWNKLTNKVENTEKDILKLSNFFKKVILDDNGEIRLVDKKKFNEHIFDDQKTRKATELQFKSIDDKLLLIIYHLNIDMDDSKTLKKSH